MVSAADRLRNVAQRWWVVALLATLGATAGYGYALLAQPTYVARAYVAAVARGAGDNAAAVSFAQAYAKIVSQGDVVNAAVDASGGGIAPGEIRRQVQASATSGGPVIEIAGSGGDAQRAANLANLVAAGVISVSAEQSDRTRVDLILLSRADPPAEPVSPRPLVDIAVGAAVGVLLGGLALVTGAELRRTTARPSQPTVARPPEFRGGPEERSLSDVDRATVAGDTARSSFEGPS